MARQCEVCSKGKIIVRRLNKLRGKYNPSPKREQKPNLQWFKPVSGSRLLICSKCRKTLIRKGTV